MIKMVDEHYTVYTQQGACSFCDFPAISYMYITYEFLESVHQIPTFHEHIQEISIMLSFQQQSNKLWVKISAWKPTAILQVQRKMNISLYFQWRGWARTQTPTNTNYTPELPTFGVIARVSRTEVQWFSLALGVPPSWSWFPLCQVSMPFWPRSTDLIGQPWLTSVVWPVIMGTIIPLVFHNTER